MSFVSVATPGPGHHLQQAVGGKVEVVEVHFQRKWKMMKRSEMTGEDV